MAYPLTVYVRLFMLLATSVLGLKTVGWCQAFTDGDPGGLLYTNHVGGFLGHGVSLADFNGDGHDDLTFTQFQGEIRFYEGDGNGQFAQADLGILNTGGEAKCALWADLDGDGDQDLFVTQRLAPNRLYSRMPDGSLQEVPNAGGMAGTSLERAYGASIADYDQDQRLDVYVCHYHTPQSNSESNRLFRGDAGVDLDMSFADVTVAAGVGNGVKQSFQSTWVDVDRDGLLDLHVINDRTGWPDALYRNLGDGTFMDMAASWGIDIGIYSMSSSFGDFDKDLDWDIMVSNGAVDGNRFLVCQGAPFQSASDPLFYTDMAEEAGVLLENLAWGAMWLDVNNDSWEDLYIATGTSMYTDYPNVTNFYPNSTNGLFLNPAGSLPLEDISASINWENELTFSVAYGDHNEDGALDFISHRMGPRAALYNGVANENHWLQIMLKPNQGHPDAIGSVLTLWNDGVPSSRTLTCGSQYLSQNSRWVHFGLGNQTTVDSVVVSWYGGSSTTVSLEEVDRRIVLNEDGLVESVVSGCTYAVACNYNAEATEDNGSCDLSCTCGPGTTWDPIAGHCVVTCAADHNNDGGIGAGDLLLFLTWFGDDCTED